MKVLWEKERGGAGEVQHQRQQTILHIWPFSALLYSVKDTLIYKQSIVSGALCLAI